MGQRDGFSSGDIAKLNAMYHCNVSGSGSTSPTENHPFRPIRPLLPLRPNRPSRPNRPNRPVLNLIGNLIRPREEGDEELEGESDSAMITNNEIDVDAPTTVE